jgi:transcriptional regulator with XRE-family HTH domain
MSKLRAARLAKGLSQEECAERAEIKQTTLSTYERGLFVPPREVLLRLMSVLGEPAPEALGYRWRTEVGVEVDA